MIWLVAYIATIFSANWAITVWGVVPVGFGLMAPAAVYFVGFAFPLRDIVQRTMGRRWSVLAILIGAGLSALVSPTFALASGVTFLVSEFTDFAVYTPLAKRFALAVFLSGAAALVVDSVLFLTLAFGDLTFLPGQIVGKAWITLAVVIAINLWRSRHAVLPRNA